MFPTCIVLEAREHASLTIVCVGICVFYSNEHAPAFVQNPAASFACSIFLKASVGLAMCLTGNVLEARKHAFLTIVCVATCLLYANEDAPKLVQSPIGSWLHDSYLRGPSVGRAMCRTGAVLEAREHATSTAAACVNICFFRPCTRAPWSLAIWQCVI